MLVKGCVISRLSIKDSVGVRPKEFYCRGFIKKDNLYGDLVCLPTKLTT